MKLRLRTSRLRTLVHGNYVVVRRAGVNRLYCVTGNEICSGRLDRRVMMRRMSTEGYFGFYATRIEHILARKTRSGPSGQQHLLAFSEQPDHRIVDLLLGMPRLEIFEDYAAALKWMKVRPDVTAEDAFVNWLAKRDLPVPLKLAMVALVVTFLSSLLPSIRRRY